MESARNPGVEPGTYRTVCFCMLSCLIFKSSVDRGIPSLGAAAADFWDFNDRAMLDNLTLDLALLFECKVRARLVIVAKVGGGNPS